VRAKKHWKARVSAQIFLAHLRRLGIAAPARFTTEPTKASVLADEFCEWMRRHRGLTEASIRAYRRVATRLLEHLGTDATTHTASAVRAAVLAETGEHGISKAKSSANVMRAYLRYSAMMGRCSANLADSVSRVAGWKLTSLPRHLAPRDVTRLLASCDSATPAGLRDRAVLLLLSRLGLRAGDVAGLRLSDVDWSDCTIRVTGKGRRETRLPLSQEVGDAILAYLEHGRPRTSTSHLFVRITAPHCALASNSVSGIVIRALDRAGVDAPVRGAHLLRHSAAMAMLREGASLHGIGTVLRHQSVETTAHYARVDTEFLAQVAQPWIEVAPC
jgi:site-specific recombinase XerD